MNIGCMHPLPSVRYAAQQSCAGEIKIVGLLVLSTFLLGERQRPIAPRLHATIAACRGCILAVQACSLRLASHCRRGGQGADRENGGGLPLSVGRVHNVQVRS